MPGLNMRRFDTPNRATGVAAIAQTTCLVALLAIAGCKSTTSVVNDATLTGNIQSTLAADSVLAGQPVQVSVAGGVATLTGYVSNDAQRAVAARDAAAVAGVAKVVNDISVGTPPPASVTATVAPPPMPAQTPARKTTQLLKPQPPHQAAPIERQQQAISTPPPPPQPAPQPAPTPAPAPAPPPPPPPPPPQPTYKTVTVASGNTIPVRITQTLDSATTQADTTFSGVVASDIVIDGLVAIPAGSNVTGHVDAVQEAAHFKGSSLLTVSLTDITRRGEHLAVTTDPYTVKGKGRGANTAEKTGGGAAVGAILGGIFGGGKGAAIGAAAGGGVGAGSQTVTRGEQVQIESESVVRFHLSSPISVKVRTDTAEHHGDDGALQPRSN
jgi:hypothetical protein